MMSRSRPFQVSIAVTLLIGCFPNYEFGPGRIEALGGSSGTSGASSIVQNTTGVGAVTGTSTQGSASHFESGGQAGSGLPTLGGATGFAGQASDVAALGTAGNEPVPSSGGSENSAAGAATGGDGGAADTSTASGGTTASGSGGTSSWSHPTDVCGSSELTCVPAIPTGWSPVVISTAATLAELPSCDSASAYTMFFDVCSQVSRKPATCSTCPECPLVKDATQSVTMSVATNCHGPAVTTNVSDSSVTTSGDCSNIRIERSRLSTATRPFYVGFSVMFKGGKCDPDVIPHDRDPSTEPACLQQMRICRGATPVGSCASNAGVCVPTVPSRFTGNCIFQPGNQTCPDYWNNRQVVDSISDERRCADCTCSPIEYPASSAWLTNWGLNDSCMTASNKGRVALADCHTSSDFEASGTFNAWFKVSDVTSTAPRCTSTGGGPIRSVVTGSSYTVCCNTPLGT